MIRLEVLGGLRILRDGEELPSLASRPRRAAMLVFVAVERNVSREKLCSVLWAESAPDKARHALSQTLYELRRDLGSSWIEASGDALAVTADLQTDLDAFEEAVASENPEKIIELYEGPFLDGVSIGGVVEFEHWTDAKRSRIHRSVREAFRTAVESEPSPHRRAQLARSWIRFDRLEDEAHHALIEALGKAGNRSEALARYEEYEELIAAELEVEPLDHTKQLVEQIRNGELAVPEETDSKRSNGEIAWRSPPAAAPVNVDRGTHGEIGLPCDLTVLRELGSGATGRVYLAREPALDRLVAVKVLDPELAEDEVARTRFEREARAAARILHPHVATVLRVGLTTNGIPYFVMPYVKGRTLREHMKARGPMPEDEVRTILSEIASALAAAHGQRLVHRDVRPDNVLYEESTERTFLADFGIAAVLDAGGRKLARLTRTGEQLGSPQYMSPEQRDGLHVDGRSDVYSLGVMGWELLTGRRFFPTSLENSEPELDEHLVDLLRRATNEEAANRPTAAEFAEEVTSETGSALQKESAAGYPKRRLWQVSLAYATIAIVMIIGVGLVPEGPFRTAAVAISTLVLGGALMVAIGLLKS